MAFWGNAAFANDWQWLFGIPILAGVFSYARGTTTVSFFSNAIIDGIAAAAVVFAVTWIVGFGVRLANAPVRLFHEEKNRADITERLLTEKITPKFAVSFDQERGGITYEKDKTELRFPGTYNGTRVFPGPMFNAAYLRICIIATSELPVKNCHAFIRFLEKSVSPNDSFTHIPLPHPMPLESEPFEVMAHIPRMVDFMKASEQDNKFVRTGHWSNALEDVFIDPATYRFTIVVNGDGITAKPIKIDVVWQGAWDRIFAHQVPEA